MLQLDLSQYMQSEIKVYYCNKDIMVNEMLFEGMNKIILT